MRLRQQADVREFADGFGEKLHALAYHFETGINAYPGDVAARACQIRYDPGGDGIRCPSDDWDCLCFGFKGENKRVRHGTDDIGLRGDNFMGNLRETVKSSISRIPVDD